jgi:GTP-binding protein
MRIKTARFIISNSEVEKCPQSPLPEYAFIGRSNVGKSSLINSLCNQKSLAKTSSRPGKTQLINHFLINENWHLVDLPGYGYARVSKAKKKVFQSFITNYFRERKQLISAFVLIDIRHQPQEIDLKFIEWLGNNEIPFALVFTKADKLKPQAATKNLEQYKEEMLATLWESLPPIFVTSSLKATGGDALLAYIDELNQLFRESSKF